MTSPRYNIVHPMLTPERYTGPAKTKDGKVRGLYIPQDRPTSPEVILDTPQGIKISTFAGYRFRCIHFRAGFHMYINDNQGILMIGENVVATHLMRLHYAFDIGVYLPDTIYGDVCLFGSGHVAPGIRDNHDYSVPYEIVEQIIHLYEEI